jgi:membrane-bound lytic murein transglycosylase D
VDQIIGQHQKQDHSSELKAKISEKVPKETLNDKDFWKKVTQRQVTQPSEENSKSVATDSPSSLRSSRFLSYPISQKLFKKWMKYFLKREPERFQRHLNNAAKVRQTVENILEQHDLPKELFFVGLIESGYNTFIKSRASATGPWQFMKGTGRRYGLIINQSIDERFNLVKATEAASRYFLDLYNIFGGWELALCAYNSGEYKVIRAIRKGNTRNLNELIRKKLLPRETRNYVPKLMAARELLINHEKYGFQFKEHKPKNDLPSIEIGRSFNLRRLGRQTGVSVSLLKQLNPEIKSRWAKVPRGKSLEVHLPYRAVKKVNLAKLGPRRAPRRSRRSASRSVPRTYRVRRGDHLSAIANRFQVSLNSLLRANKLKLSSKIYPGQKLVLTTLPEKVRIYRVQAGDNLSHLAQKFGVNRHQIQRDNRLASTRIYVGQKLRIRRGRATYKVYRIRRGDTLYGLSRKFGTSVRAIKKVNRFNGSRLLAGTEIKIPLSRI